eukprot:1142377-Pelagomonas_calceolata.AAC.12
MQNQETSLLANLKGKEKKRLRLPSLAACIKGRSPEGKGFISPCKCPHGLYSKHCKRNVEHQHGLHRKC